MQHAIQDAYRTMMERGRHPTVLLDLDVDPRLVDVNVHPQKTEVRFTDSGMIHRAITRALGRCLSGQPWAKDPAYELKPFTNHGASWSADRDTAPGTYRQGSGVKAGFSKSYATGMAGANPAGSSDSDADWEYVPAQARLTDEPGFFSSLEPIGQVMSTYLVCQARDKMVLIDQHAAHERIAFQRMMNQHEKGQLEVQPLLIPQSIELDAERQAVASESEALLKSCGFMLQQHNDKVWMLKTIPAILSGRKTKEILLDLLDEIQTMNKTTPMDEALESLFSCAACHSVVRAGDALSKEEIGALLKQMDESALGTLCPHGRPVYYEWSAETLAKLFHRS